MLCYESREVGAGKEPRKSEKSEEKARKNGHQKK
jgi:hypothetical protein